METSAELTLGLGEVHPGTGTQHEISPPCNFQPGFMLGQGMSHWTHLVLLGHLSLGSWPGAGCKIMIDLSAGAPVWFGNHSATMNSLILPSAGIVELQTLQWGLGDQGKLISPHGCCWLCSWQHFHETEIPVFLQGLAEGRMKLLRGLFSLRLSSTLSFISILCLSHPIPCVLQRSRQQRLWFPLPP